MAEKPDEEWACNSNDAVTVRIVDPSTDASSDASSFNPQFTYPIFGEEESIFGYKDLAIQIDFAAHDLYPHASISHGDKFKPVGDIEAIDVKAKLQEFLPSYAFEDRETFDAHLQSSQNAAFTPPGKLLHSYNRDGTDFEIWCGELTDPAVKLLLERMQIFVSFFIEGGVPLNLDEEEWSLARWRVFFVYERSSSPASNVSPYSIVGYSTSYRFLTYVPVGGSAVGSLDFTLADAKPVAVASLPNRSRISQFLILPTHQHQGHGSHLYNTMFETLHQDPACIEITVEDPNEAFDDLRDYCDFQRLTANGSFGQLQLRTDIDPKLTQRGRTGARVPTAKLVDRMLYEKLRARNKIAPRQYHRLVEMYLLSQIPKHSRTGGAARLTQRAKATDPGDRALYYWRLLAKQRIYRQNKDVLAQFEPLERVEKLEQTLEGQEADYERLLEIIEKGLAKSKNPQSAGGSASTKDRGKRKVLDDEDEDEDSGRETKRAKSVAMADS